MTAEVKFENAELTILVTQTSQEAKMTWQGASDTRDPATFLQPVFRRVVEQIEGRTLTIDFTGLEFMNSSTVSPIIGLLKTLDRKGIKSRVLFNDDDWQQVHMRCLRAITRVLHNVEVLGMPRAS